jgi:hypothetical protein
MVVAATNVVSETAGIDESPTVSDGKSFTSASGMANVADLIQN